jgi:hypothetical protein
MKNSSLFSLLYQKKSLPLQCIRLAKARMRAWCQQRQRESTLQPTYYCRLLKKFILTFFEK